MIALLSKERESTFEKELIFANSKVELLKKISKFDLHDYYNLQVEHINLDVVNLLQKGSFERVKYASVPVEYDETIIIYQEEKDVLEYIMDTIEGITSNIQLYGITHDITEVKSMHQLTSELCEIKSGHTSKITDADEEIIFGIISDLESEYDDIDEVIQALSIVLSLEATGIHEIYESRIG